MSPATRSSARLAKNSPTEDDGCAGTKRKADTTPSKESKRGRKAGPKKQSTIEDTIANGYEKLPAEESGNVEEPGKDEKPKEENGSGPTEEISREEDAKEEPKHTKQTKEASNEAESKTSTDTIQKSPSREKRMPSSIFEKGILYFFARNRVGVEKAENVGDLQRTYFVLRPLPLGAKLGDGAIPDEKNNRLFALPKKTLPKSHRDRFMAFVEKANASIQDLKADFFSGKEYETKTMGTRHVEPITPIGEGVYAITRSEDLSTHLAYILTIPSEVGEVQKDLGLRSQGSFHISVKNPERGGPAAARLPKGPEFPKEILEEFRGLAWVAADPKYLDYPNAQILLIGEGVNDELGKAVEQTHKDKKHDKEHPKDEIEALEHEDELRVQNLNGDDSIFDDLKISKKEYPQVPTTW